jgi:hypothetical protein
MARVLVLLPLGLLLILGGRVRAADERSPTVGVTARIDGLVLPGTELEVTPVTDRLQPVIVRIARTWPHGTAFRYDLEYYGLEAGRFDLKKYLRRKDGSSADDLPVIAIEVRTVLPQGQVLPHDPELQPVPSLGGYWLVLTLAGGAWLVGLLLILLAGRRKRGEATPAAGRPRTLADHLRPLIEGAVTGRLQPAQLAELERSLLVYWERRLNLGDRKPAEAIAELRRHPEAGPLLRQLETWLHRPGPAGGVDVAGLLRPYRDVPAEPVATRAGAC